MLYGAIAVALAVIVVSFCLGFSKGFVKSSWWGINYTLTALIVTLTFACVPVLESAFLNFLLKLVIGVALSLIIFFLAKFIKGKIKNLSDGAHGIIATVPENREEESLFIDQIKGDFEPVQPKKVNSMYVFGNKMLGGINASINAIVACFLTVLILFSGLECFQASSITSSFATLYNSSFWTSLKPYIFDILLIGAFLSAIAVVGYKTGLCEKLWKVLHIVMLIVSVVGSYLLITKNAFFMEFSELFASWLRNEVGFLSDTTLAMEGLKSFMKFIVADDIALLIANIIYTILLGLILILITQGINKGVKVAFKNVRENQFFFVLDGVLGGVAVFALMLCALLFFGALLFAVNGTPALEIFNEYAEYSEICCLFYSENPINWVFI